MFEELGNWQYILSLCFFVGVVKVTLFTLNFLTLIKDLFLVPATDYSKYGNKLQCWALVTGASDGLGLEYARQLAARGFNIVLVSRTLSKLEALSDELIKTYNVDTKVISVDVTKESAIDTIIDQVKFLDISILINNVGLSHSIPTPFVEVTKEELNNIIKINNVFTLNFTQQVIPILEATVQKRSIKGLILTMGSFGGLLPTPYLSVYSGSKAFLQNWSNCLSAELAPKNIDAEFMVSYLVTSAMSKVRRVSLTVPNAKTFVGVALNSVGRRNGSQERFATNTPYWVHAFMHFGIDQTVGIYSKVANSLNLGMHKSIRVRALRKAARLNKQK